MHVNTLLWDLELCSALVAQRQTVPPRDSVSWSLSRCRAADTKQGQSQQQSNKEKFEVWLHQGRVAHKPSLPQLLTAAAAAVAAVQASLQA